MVRAAMVKPFASFDREYSLQPERRQEWPKNPQILGGSVGLPSPRAGRIIRHQSKGLMAQKNAKTLWQSDGGKRP
jgi:hypothetical protein